ncbi:unnamed protein product [Adineta steineri]|uniref:Uncharacterized protein n=1 Tax=Adineta steineri TaxID=433720 RepID=A0A813WIN4_9BILA|nr:unnamed protein product [Adineta steineri]CAF1432571.1 unnamed protein product [Adineta steineri]
MNERDEIEQQKSQVSQTVMKKDKKCSKTENRFKSKFKSLKKLPHSTSANSAVEKARTFFRSLELKRHNEQSSSSSSITICQNHTIDIPSTPSITNTTIMNEETRKFDFMLNPIARTTNISITKGTKVDKINPTDMIVYRVMDNDQNYDKLPLNYFQQKYKQYLKPSLLYPKQYYNELLNKQNQHYSISIDKRNSFSHNKDPTFNPDMRYSTRIYPPFRYPPANNNNNNNSSSNHQISNSLYDNPLLICSQMESSFLVPSSCDQSASSIIRPLPTSSSSSSSSSTLTWNQCVDRLNTEYRSTIDALELAKEYLEDVYIHPTDSISKYANLVARGINDLSNNETKKSSSVTFCLPSSIDSDIEKYSSLKLNNSIEKSKVPPPILFSKPKLVKPIELDTFSSCTKFDSSVENDEKLDSIASIIKKFNDLSNSIASTIEKCQIHEKIMDNSTTCKLKKNSDKLISSELVSTNEQTTNNLQEEETTYTIETFYKPTNNDLLINIPPIIITRENTTAEQFELVYEKQHQEISTNTIPTQEKSIIDEIKLSPINERSSNCEINDTSSNNTPPPVPPKNIHKFISQIPKSTITTMHGSRLKPSSKLVSSFNKLKPSSSTIINNTMTSLQNPVETINNTAQLQSLPTPTQPSSINDKNISKSPNGIDPTCSIRKNYVKSMVCQLNTTVSAPSVVSPSTTNKRSCRRMLIEPITFTNKNAI